MDSYPYIILNCGMENSGQTQRSSSVIIEKLNETLLKGKQRQMDSEQKMNESLKHNELMAEKSSNSINLEKDQQIENLKKEMEELKNAFWKSLTEQIRMKKDLEESEETRKDAERAVLMLHEQLAKERARSTKVEQELEEEIEDLVEELEKSGEALKKMDEKVVELTNSSYRFENRQAKRKLFKEMDDKLEFGEGEDEKEEVKRKIRKYEILCENGDSDNEI